MILRGSLTGAWNLAWLAGYLDRIGPTAELSHGVENVRPPLEKHPYIAGQVRVGCMDVEKRVADLQGRTGPRPGFNGCKTHGINLVGETSTKRSLLYGLAVGYSRPLP